MEWCSAHLYTAGVPVGTVLKLFLKPFTAKHTANGTLGRFFYVRYFDTGAHIRFRFYGTAAVNKALCEALENTYTQWRMAFTHPPAPQEELVRYTPYLPEFTRYGGRGLIDLAEEYFVLSSRTMLSLIDDSEVNRYENILAQGIQLNFIFVNTLRKIGIDVEALLTMATDSWLPFTVGRLMGRDLYVKGTLHEKEVCLSVFRENFAGQRKSIFNSLVALEQYQEELWDQPVEDTDGLIEWIAGNVALLQTIEQRLDKQGLSGPEKESIRFSVYSSLMHMNNNRIGVVNHDESYIAYILKEYISRPE